MQSQPHHVRFLFRVALRRLDLAAEIYHIKGPQKIPLLMSPDEPDHDGASRIYASTGELSEQHD
jgi:hypothetical protein